MSDAEIVATTNTAFSVVDHYWSNLFGTWHGNYGEPIQWWTPDRYHGDGFYDSDHGSMAGCVDDYENAQNAFFCGDIVSGTGFVAWDKVLFRQLALFGGDDAIYGVVAHEIGHAAQTRFWHDNEGGATPSPDDDIPWELQADCLSGATLGKAEQDGYVDIDLDSLLIALMLLNEPGNHGTDEQRAEAIMQGFYTGDIESCLYNQGVPPPGFPR